MWKQVAWIGNRERGIHPTLDLQEVIMTTQSTATHPEGTHPPARRHAARHGALAIRIPDALTGPCWIVRSTMTSCFGGSRALFRA